MECKNGDDCIGDCVASCAADGGVGGCAWKTDVFGSNLYSIERKTKHGKRCKKMKIYKTND